MRTIRFAIALAALAAFATGCERTVGDTLSVTGQIEATSIDVGSRIGGRVSEVLAREGDRAGKGDILARLEDKEPAAAMAAAKSNLARAEAMLRKLEAGARPEQLRQVEAAARQAEEQYLMATRGARTQEVEAARRAMEAARAQRDDARLEMTRARGLLAEGAAPQRLYDKARHAYEAAQAQYEASRERLDMVMEGARTEEVAMAKAAYDRAAAALDEVRSGARQEDLDAARAARDAAAADVDRAQAAMDETVVVAPRAGTVESVAVHPGDLVAPGAFIRFTDPDDLELMVYVSAAMLGFLRVGQEVPITTDALGDQRFTGRLVYIASEGEFTPRNLQTEEERVQQVFGVKIETDSADGRLRAGMYATAHLPLRQGTDP